MCSCGDDHDHLIGGQHIYAGGEQVTLSRRDLLRGGAAAVMAGGAAALFPQAPAAAQAPAVQAPPAPGVGATANGGGVFLGDKPRHIEPQTLLAPRPGPPRTAGVKVKA